MKALYIVFLMLLFGKSNAQDDSYLSIQEKQGLENEVNYPPGTDFFLFDQNGDLVLANGDLEEPFIIQSPHILLVTPTYKSGTDRYTLSSGRILMKDNSAYGKAIKKGVSHWESNGITARKEYFEAKYSTDKNVLVIFSNDLVFRYFDGNARAWLDGDKVEIKGKYLVQTPEGQAKISYNAKNGELWWVFDNR